MEMLHIVISQTDSSPPGFLVLPFPHYKITKEYKTYFDTLSNTSMLVMVNHNQ